MPTPLFEISPQPTAEQLADEKASRLSQVKMRSILSAQQLLEGIDTLHRAALDAIWNNGYSTPAEAVAELGTEAVRLFTGSQATTAYLVQQYALAGVDYTPYAFPAGVTITPNADGSVTVS